jgi:hypothetical protein
MADVSASTRAVRGTCGAMSGGGAPAAGPDARRGCRRQRRHRSASTESAGPRKIDSPGRSPSTSSTMPVPVAKRVALIVIAIVALLSGRSAVVGRKRRKARRLTGSVPEHGAAPCLNDRLVSTHRGSRLVSTRGRSGLLTSIVWASIRYLPLRVRSVRATAASSAPSPAGWSAPPADPLSGAPRRFHRGSVADRGSSPHGDGRRASVC